MAAAPVVGRNLTVSPRYAHRQQNATARYDFILVSFVKAA
jgi:hypothetical protein